MPCDDDLFDAILDPQLHACIERNVYDLCDEEELESRLDKVLPGIQARWAEVIMLQYVELREADRAHFAKQSEATIRASDVAQTRLVEYLKRAMGPGDCHGVLIQLSDEVNPDREEAIIEDLCPDIRSGKLFNCFYTWEMKAHNIALSEAEV